MQVLLKGFTDTITIGGKAVLVADPTINTSGGMIINPSSYLDQHINPTEVLYVDVVSPAYAQSKTTIALFPGQEYIVPAGSSVWVNADSSGHKFTAFFSRIYTIQYPPSIVPGQPSSNIGIGGLGIPFPTDKPSGLTKVIPSYLYQEYTDDDDLQGFVDAQNSEQQNYVDTFNALNLPIYTGPIVSGPLLDWVGAGLYGLSRPSIGVGLPVQIGPLNTWGPNFLPAINEIIQISHGNVVITNDDLYRRILTWHFFKGDPQYFSARWMKRRVWRFLYGYDGISPDYAWIPAPDQPLPPGYADAAASFIADTEQISVSVGANRDVTIRFVLGNRTVTGGAILNLFGPNGFGPSWKANTLAPTNYADIQLNEIETVYTRYKSLPYMSTFKNALDSGVLETPYQFNFTCTIG